MWPGVRRAGVTSVGELRQAGAHVVLPDPTDSPQFVEIIRDLTGGNLQFPSS